MTRHLKKHGIHDANDPQEKYKKGMYSENATIKKMCLLKNAILSIITTICKKGNFKNPR